MTPCNLDQVKVGDLVAPMPNAYGRNDLWRWGGMLHQVTHVSPKRIVVCGYKIVKATGFRVGYTEYSTRWVKATPEQIREVADKEAKRIADEKAKAAFDAREDVMLARRLRHCSLDAFLKIMSIGLLRDYNELLDELEETDAEETDAEETDAEETEAD